MVRALAFRSKYSCADSSHSLALSHEGRTPLESMRISLPP